LGVDDRGKGVPNLIRNEKSFAVSARWRTARITRVEVYLNLRLIFMGKEVVILTF